MVSSDKKRMSVNSDDSEHLGWGARICQQWHAFLLLLWNPADKTVFGRGGKSWAQILIFYTFYYAFLAGLFALAITIVLGTLDPYTPKFQTRLQAPGLGIQPRELSKDALTTDIKFNEKDPETYNRYVDLFKTYLKNYQNQSDEEFFLDCANGPVQNSQEFGDNEIARVCKFDTSSLKQCAIADYGYDQGKPCILLRANRIVKWFPVSFYNLDDAVGNDVSDAPPLREVLTALKRTYNPYIMYFSCYGSDAENHKWLTGSEYTNDQIQYYPDGVEFKYYPYYGHERSPQYKTPVVAVQFQNVTRNQEIKVRCKAYSRNIVDDSRMDIGYMQFRLTVNSES